MDVCCFNQVAFCLFEETIPFFVMAHKTVKLFGTRLENFSLIVINGPRHTLVFVTCILNMWLALVGDFMIQTKNVCQTIRSLFQRNKTPLHKENPE